MLWLVNKGIANKKLIKQKINFGNLKNIFIFEGNFIQLILNPPIT